MTERAGYAFLCVLIELIQMVLLSVFMNHITGWGIWWSIGASFLWLFVSNLRNKAVNMQETTKRP